MVKITRGDIDISKIRETGFKEVKAKFGGLFEKMFSNVDSIESIIPQLNAIKVKRLEQINKLLERIDDEFVQVKLQKEQKVLNDFTPSDLRNHVIGDRINLREFPEFKELIVFYGLQSYYY